MSTVRAIICSIALLACAASASATWSIILIDTATGEIAIGSATCLTGFDLKRGASVVVVGKGAAAAQSFVDQTGENRQLIFAELMAGTDPEEILLLLDAQDSGHQTRQYGIVDVLGRAETFTGTGAGAWAGGITGQTGSIVYAIQGNVLTGEPVVAEAERAVLESTGDLPTRLMEAMEAAMLMGGDGRCSCQPNDPEGCGAPPASFEKSAHIGYITCARLGDTDGVCDRINGCASGDYFMDFNVAFQSAASPDPVLQLRQQFDTWRTGLQGVADAIRSEAVFTDAVIPPDGSATSTLTITLKDWDGQPVDPTSVAVSVVHAPDSDGLAAIGPVNDLGGGSYSAEFAAASTEGRDRFRIVADDGVRPVILMPEPEIHHRWLDIQTPDGLPALIDPDGGTTFRVQIDPVGGIQLSPGTATLEFDAGNGPMSVPLIDNGNGELRAYFPPTLCPSDVSYTIHAMTTEGQTARLPFAASAPPFSTANYSDITNLAYDDFESDSGWTSENIDAQRGDWERGVPKNDPGWIFAPTEDSDGSGQCWLTDNGLGTQGVVGGSVRLTSPTFSMIGATALAYDWFLVVTFPDGIDHVLVEMEDGDGLWREVFVHATGNDLEWETNTISRETIESTGLRITDQMRIRFTAFEGGFPSVAEAAIDAFRILGPDCTLRCPADLTDDGILNTNDIVRFLNALTTAQPAADVAQPYGQWGEADLNTFLGWFDEGCR